jgi:hypothetical protein
LDGNQLNSKPFSTVSQDSNYFCTELSGVSDFLPPHDQRAWILSGCSSAMPFLTLHIGAISAALAGRERRSAKYDGLPILLEIIIFLGN